MAHLTTDFGKTNGISAPATPPAANLPPEFIEIRELRAASIERRLGYFRNERFVIFGYCPAGGEVVWKDGNSSGFGCGGWRAFQYEITPLILRSGVSIGGEHSTGTHVILIDRTRGIAYTAPRKRAEEYLATVNHVPPPRRRCLCAMLDSASCPFCAHNR